MVCMLNRVWTLFSEQKYFPKNYPYTCELFDTKHFYFYLFHIISFQPRVSVNWKGKKKKKLFFITFLVVGLYRCMLFPGGSNFILLFVNYLGDKLYWVLSINKCIFSKIKINVSETRKCNQLVLLLFSILCFIYFFNYHFWNKMRNKINSVETLLYCSYLWMWA